MISDKKLKQIHLLDASVEIAVGNRQGRCGGLQAL